MNYWLNCMNKIAAVELAKAYQPKLRDELTISVGVNVPEDIQVSEPR